MTEVVFISENGLEREIKVEAGQKTGMVLVVLPGTSCDIRLDVTLAGEKIQKYFPKSYTPAQMEAVILKLLEAWQRKRERDQSR